MTKDDLLKLAEAAEEINNAVTQAIQDLTKDKPFILFDPKKITQFNDPVTEENEDFTEMDAIYEMPYAWKTDKNGFYYDEGRIQSVQGTDVKVFMTSEGQHGEIEDMELWQIPENSRIELLKLIAEKTE